ncbi:MAG: DUF4293 domain-containing protein [Rikenellaceae bacterium]
MIQRIQSIYLLVACVLMTLTALMPLAYFSNTYEFFNLYAAGLRGADGTMVQTTPYMLALVAASAILPLINIFLFKRRMLQIRLCVVEVVILIGASIMMGLYIFLSYRTFSTLELSAQGFKPILVFPIISIVLSLFAAKAIFRDELLVKSVDRIR